MNYKPKPIDVSMVRLPRNFDKLVDVLAKNLHDKWAAMRIEEGWTYGLTRNDVGKTHPYLVAFNDLPESERLFNKKITSETLKALGVLGFKIDRYLEAGEQWLLD
ncbi:MAG: RyR domain-containing protein, partial [Deltaproteobacteria bacterium]